MEKPIVKRLEEEWNEYQNMLIPPDTSYTITKESRRAFYAGAMCLLKIMSSMFSMGEQVTAEDMFLMASLNEEIKEYVEKVEAGLG